MDYKLFSLRTADLALTLAGLLLLAGCPPETPRTTQAELEAKQADVHGTYYSAPNKLFDQDVKFDIRWNVTHQPQTDTFNPGTNVSDRELAIMRCTHCHEC